jgi:hypothetical protein
MEEWKDGVLRFAALVKRVVERQLQKRITPILHYSTSSTLPSFDPSILPTNKHNNEVYILRPRSRLS